MNGFEQMLSLAADALSIITGVTGYGISVWFLALIFGWSGMVKLRRPMLAAMAMVNFRVVRHVRPHLGLALGTVEFFLALALAVGIFPHLFLPITAALLWCFVLLIARSLWSGARFACFCFGDTDSQLSLWTLVRTLALALLATVLALSAVPLDILPRLSGAYVLQAVAAAALLGTGVLASYIPRLLLWNHDPLGGHVR